jgi:hypothetical protein
MYNIGKYLLLVEKRVDINPLKPSVVHKNHDKSVLFHSYIHSILYKVPILFTSCRAKCRFYLLLVESTFRKMLKINSLHQKRNPI